MIDLPPPSYEQTIAAIARCGIPRENVRINYEDYLQSDEVTISELGVVSDEKMRCLKAAVHPFYILTIQNEKQQAAFYEFSEREDRPKRLSEAREWVESNGLMNKLPTYDPKKGIEEFAMALELACGLKRGSALMSYGDSTLAVRPDFVSADSLEMSAESLHCLTQMFAAAEAIEHGVRLVFIGNQAIVEEDKK